MRNKLRLLFFIIAILALLSLVLPASAQDDMPDAEIQNDEGGVEIINGEFNYTDPTLATTGSQPIIVLTGMSTYVDPNFVYTYGSEYVATDEPQYIGEITSDIAESPFTYTLHLPIDPTNKLVDVDNDGESDTGVMLYNVTFTFNEFGDQFINAQDFSYDESTTTGEDIDNLALLNGGKMIVYAPDDQQGFPSGWGDDHKIFTDDDPIVRLPQGWTVVDLDTDPFTFDRSKEATVDIIEPPSEVSPDFSDMSYTEAFDAMIDLMRTHYAFTEFHHVDWDALVAEFRPRLEEAEKNNDVGAYSEALQDFTYAIPDGHVGIDSSPYLEQQPFPPPDIAGGLGMAIRELSDGRVIANFIGEDSPAADAGIELRAEILEIDGKPIDEAISAEPGLNPPYASETLKRLDQLRDVMRYPVGQDVEVTFQNPGDTEPQTVTMTTVEEDESRIFSRTSLYGDPQATDLPLEYEILDSGYGYIAIYSFFDNNLLTAELWKRAIQAMNDNGVKGVIIDMRYNGGGSTALYQPMAGYFFDEPLVGGNTGFYVENTGEFVYDPHNEDRIVPAPENERYHGEVAVLVGPSCFSACEFFSYFMTLNDRAAIVGQYPTGGLGGSISYFFMPEDTQLQYTTGPAVDPNGDIHIEGSGVEPTVVVPVDEETLFSEGDPVLDAAINYLDEATAPDVTDAGTIDIGNSVDGDIAVNERVRYTLTSDVDTTLDIKVGDDEQAVDTVLTIYDEDENVLAENDDADPGVNINSEVIGLEVKAGDTIIIEISTFDDAGEGSYTLSVDGATS